MALQQHDSLSEKSVTQLAQLALLLYPIEMRGNLRLLCRSENSTFLVQTRAKRYALRIHRDNYHSRKSIHSELLWLDALQGDTGIVTPRALPGLNGERVQTLPLPDGSHRNIVLFEWIDGEMPTATMNPRTFRQLGEVTARLHRHSRQWQKPADLERIIWNHSTMVGPQGHWGYWRTAPGLCHEDALIMDAAVACMEKKLCAYGLSAHRFGLIHADLRLTNLLLHKDGPRVIDFDDCGLGWFVHDIAAAFSFEEHCPHAPLWLDNWLQGYEQSGHLEDQDIEMIPHMIMQRRIQMTAWMATHATTETARNYTPQWIEHTVGLCKRYLEGGMPLGAV